MPPAAYLDQRLHLRLDAFPVEALDAVRRLFVHDNPELANWKKFRSTKWAPKPFVGTWKQSGGYLHVPRGRLLEVCQALSMEPRGSIDDRRVVGKTHHFKLTGLEERAYQSRLVETAIERETCLARAPTASGKTSAAFRYIERIGMWSLVVVPNRALLDQWVKRARNNFGIEPAIIQGSKKQVGPLTIALQASLLTCLDEVLPHFGVLVCDEVQQFAAKTFNEVIENCAARYRLGVSNDEHRADGKEYLIHDQFGPPPPGAVIERQELLDLGAVCDVSVRMVPSDFSAPWYVGLSPDQKFLHRSRLIQEMNADEARNALVVSAAQWCLAEGEQVAVLTQLREHCSRLDSLLQQLCPTGQLLGGEGDHAAFVDSLTRFAAGELRAVVGTYKAIGVGFESHQRLARGVFASPLATQDTVRMQFMQYLGRFARAAPGKLDAVVYVVFDPHVHGDRPVRLVRKWVSDCSVLDASGAFIPAKQYLKGTRSENKKRRGQPADSEPEDDLFQQRPRS